MSFFSKVTRGMDFYSLFEFYMDFYTGEKGRILKVLKGIKWSRIINKSVETKCFKNVSINL